MPTKKSLDNLRPRKPRYGIAKQRHEITVTAESWEGLQAMAAAGGCSVSELIERFGRGLISSDGPQGDILEVISWGLIHCKARDAAGNTYACKRVGEGTP